MTPIRTDYVEFKGNNPKFIFIGDGTVGKTSICVSYLDNIFAIEYKPTIMEIRSTEIEIINLKKKKKKVLSVEINDTAGQECFDRLRSVHYRDSDVFLIVFNVADRVSFENVETKWVDDIRPYIRDRKDVTVILVANQIDQRTNPNTIDNLTNMGQKIVTEKEGLKMAKKICADQYCEVSALSKQGINNLFQSAAKIVIHKRKRSIKSKNNFNCLSK